MKNDLKLINIVGSYLTADECKYNCRYKYIPDENGELHLIETMVTRRFIFNPDNVKLSGVSAQIEHNLFWDDALDEMYGRRGNVTLLAQHADNIECSRRRAVRKISDYIMCNKFDLFCTLTLDPDRIDRYDYSAAMKKLKSYLDNRVRRRGLIYLGVPELHKRGGLHFHFLVNRNAIDIVDSGTVSVAGHKRPIKIATADRLGVPLSERHTVYNIPDWKLGFTTAIPTYGNAAALANYVSKYITKSHTKIGGRWYYSGGKLARPVYTYDRVSFNDYSDYDYEFKCDGGDFRIKKYDLSQC